MLHFLGRGAAFSEGNTSAFFVSGSDFVLLDSGLYLLQKLRNIDIASMVTEDGIKRIVVIVTHTHADHIGSLPLIIQYAYYFMHIPVLVVSGNNLIIDDLKFYIDNLGGCVTDSYEIKTVEASGLDWLKEAIKTDHTPELKDKCFGYRLVYEGKEIIYTGDTKVFEPFEKYFLDDKYNISELYIEMAAKKNPVHLCIDDYKERLVQLSKKGIDVYLMHIDDEAEMLKKIDNTELKLAPIYTKYLK